jgi:hypothetical protein
MKTRIHKTPSPSREKAPFVIPEKKLTKAGVADPAVKLVRVAGMRAETSI